MEKPYKVLVKSPKGSMYDKLFCIKCCSTITRNNYSTHKKNEKHIRLHRETENDETIRNRIIDDVIEGNKTTKTNKILSRKDYLKRIKEYETEPKATEISESEPEEIISDSEPELSESEQDEIPLFDTYDDELKEQIRMLYKKAKNIYKQPIDLESRKRVKYDLKQFKALIDGEIYDYSDNLGNMIIYYSKLN